MSKLNCWEFNNCGREPEGAKAHKMGICPASIFEQANGFLGGKNGGRACAYIAGTFCSQTLAGTSRDKKKLCISCDFYRLLRDEEQDEMCHSNFNDFVKRSSESG